MQQACAVLAQLDQRAEIFVFVVQMVVVAHVCHADTQQRRQRHSDQKCDLVTQIKIAEPIEHA